MKEEELIQILSTMSSESKVSFLSLNSHQACKIYSDKEVMAFFEFKMWISAHKDDDLIRTRELSILLQRVLVEKRFLLIIDDVWNHKEERDMFFKNLSIMSGKQGSKIILIKCATEITDLLDHILQKMFCKLPIRTIIGCKCVCKEWYGLIKDPSFPKMHLSEGTVYPILRTFEPSFRPSELHMIEAINTSDLTPPLKLHSKLLPPQVPLIQGPSELDIPKFGIVNSCNGLLCVCTTPFNNPIYVCNPITGEYIMLPKPKRNPENNDYMMDQEEVGELYKTNFVVSGFGFSPKTKQYKVMRIVGLETNGEKDRIVQEITLGSSSWTTLGRIRKWRHIGLKVTHRQTLLPTEAPYRRSFSVYLNGAVHWLPNWRSSPFFIGSFKFDSGDIVDIQPPDEFMERDEDAIAFGNMRLGVLHDCLYLSDISCYVHFNLWVLKDYNDPSSWTIEFVISNFSLNIWPRGLYRPIKYLDNGDLLMFHPSNALVCYNPKEESFRYFKIRGIDSDFEMVPHVPSLISMKDAINMEEPQVEILNVRDSKRVHQDWKENKDFVLVEEDEDAISAAFSKIVEGN